MGVIGIDLGGTKISVGLIQKDKLEKTVSEKINAKGSQKEVVIQIENLIDQLFNKKVKGIGIGVPAIVDVENGIVFETVNIPSWKKVPLKEILEKRYKVPVFVNNDANCFALAEKYFGKGKNYKNIVGFISGTGVGSGIIINGKLYTGNNCGAGEFGEIVFKQHNIEYYCSGKYFVQMYNITGEDLFEKAMKGDPKALKIFDEFGKNMGKTLSIVVHSVDPEIIILGGSVSKAFKFFEKSMMKSLKESIYTRSYSRLKIEISKTEKIAILGAASLYFDSLKK